MADGLALFTCGLGGPRSEQQPSQLLLLQLLLNGVNPFRRRLFQ